MTSSVSMGTAGSAILTAFLECFLVSLTTVEGGGAITTRSVSIQQKNNTHKMKISSKQIFFV